MSSYTHGIHSKNIHIPRTQYVSMANFFIDSDKSYTFAKKTILTIIVLLMMIMILFVLFNFIATPEFLIKRKIEGLTSDYYENYYYELLLKNNDTSASGQIFANYKDSGFPRITLRQLLLYGNQKHAAETHELSRYCNLDKTIIKIYPDAPFSKNNYHVDYSYSCKF